MNVTPPGHTPERDNRPTPPPEPEPAPEEQQTAENVGLLTNPEPPSYDTVMRDRAE